MLASGCKRSLTGSITPRSPNKRLNSKVKLQIIHVSEYFVLHKRPLGKQTVKLFHEVSTKRRTHVCQSCCHRYLPDALTAVSVVLNARCTSVKAGYYVYGKCQVTMIMMMIRRSIILHKLWMQLGSWENKSKQDQRYIGE